MRVLDTDSLGNGLQPISIHARPVREVAATESPDRDSGIDEAGAAGNNQTTLFMSSRLFWDLTLCLAGILYVDLVLFQQLDSPLLAMILILLAAYELIEPHLSRHKR